VEALRTDCGWLEYQLQAVRDELLDQGERTAEGASMIDMVRAVLLARDEVLQKAREDLGAMQVAVAERETALTSAQAQLQQDRATIEGARSWQSQTEEKAKEAEQLRANLADKVASLATVEEQLQLERSARYQAETQLQQGWSALKRLGPPSSVSVRLERKRRANFSRSAPRWRRRRPPSSSGTWRSRGSRAS
jgi:septal ring factor EnvC (AmiA/AmiB activator)